MTGAAVRLVDLTLAYARHPAVHHVSGEFAAGTLTAVVGPNGAGKSTLLKGIAGVMAPVAGRIEVGSVSPDAIAYLPQQAEIDRSFPITVRDTVLLGHWRRVGPFGRVGRELRQQAEQALGAVGLLGFAERVVGELSAGQFQRVLFARMMLQNAPVILLDEPFNALDSKTTFDLLELVQRWHGERRTIIVALHDLEQVRLHFPHTLLIAREPIGWGPTAEVLTPANLAAARSLAEAWQSDADICRRAA